MNNGIELITKAGFGHLQKLKESVLLCILVSAKRKLERVDNIQQKKLIQNYTNIRVRAFNNKLGVKT